jgi:catechol 2,3-dioxygenase-like lactoylglutathione lyase family enzyme
MTTFGHEHLNVTDVRAHQRFFADTIGGVPRGVGPTGEWVIGFPNALVLLAERRAAGGTKGTTVNHFAFGVPDIRRMVARVRAAGFPMVTRAEVSASLEVVDDLCYMADQLTFVAFAMAPDETKVEFIELPSQLQPVTLHHLHFAGPSAAEMKAWYVNALAAKPGRRGNFEAADLPGLNLTYSSSPVPVVGTRGRALDRIGFEVEGLDALCRRLDSLGIALERPAAPAEGLASAFFADPWGTYIELTEGMRL